MGIDELVEQIRSLTATDRRRLLRRLRINGLLDLDKVVTDHNRLQRATALSAARLRSSSRPDSSHTIAPHADHDNSETDQTEGSDPVLNPTQNYVRLDLSTGSPAAGKIVVGVPGPVGENDEKLADPHAMAPVPGQAPEKPIRITFDGGSKGNPGFGYGSYAIDWPGQESQVVRLQLGNQLTNNEAEYDTLIRALEAILKRLSQQGIDPDMVMLNIFGDSKLVIEQVTGGWKCNEKRLRVRRDRVRELLQQFEHWNLRHHDRENSVRILGH